MNEAQLQAAILECARLLGWRVYHTYNSQRSQPGFPDLTLVRDGFLIFAELKSARGRLSPEQKQWLDDLTRVSVAEDRVLTYLWTPSQWVDGTVERVLRFTGQKDRRAA